MSKGRHRAGPFGLAPGSALGSLASVALSSAQVNLIVSEGHDNHVSLNDKFTE